MAVGERRERFDPRALPQGNYGTNPVGRPMSNALAQGIIESSRALGMNPVDLATIISYETGGTFDPTQTGPTTQWGQHRGLIQFGEPQAQQYGVDWSDPLGSQLGTEGAIVDYFRDAGFQPGMGLLDAYSAVNAGRVGRYNASDANNGGAPGTVRDKVEQQMDAHRTKALALLGGDAGAPPANALSNAPMQQIDPVALIEAAQQQGQQGQIGQPTPDAPLYDFAMPQNALAPVQFDTRRYNTERLMRG